MHLFLDAVEQLPLNQDQSTHHHKEQQKYHQKIGQKKFYFELLKLDSRVKDFISENNIIPDLISSHGHTVFHNIKERISHQIGNPFVLYNSLNIPIVYNLRELDVIAGGQGAPLVPFGDKHLFSQYDYCVNIGGIINISYTNNNKTCAFDVCPANTILNYFSRKLNLEFDDKGKIASTGRFIEKLYRDLNKISYYERKSAFYILIMAVLCNIICYYFIWYHFICYYFTRF